MRCGLEVATMRGKRVDFCCYDKKDNFIFVEIKVTKSDFKSKCGHNFNGNKNYYALAPNLYDEVKDLIPDNIGVYTIQPDAKSKCYELKLLKKCKTIKNSKIKQYKKVEEHKYDIITACNSWIRRNTDNLRKIDK